MAQLLPDIFVLITSRPSLQRPFGALKPYMDAAWAFIDGRKANDEYNAYQMFGMN